MRCLSGKKSVLVATASVFTMMLLAGCSNTGGSVSGSVHYGYGHYDPYYRSPYYYHRPPPPPPGVRPPPPAVRPPPTKPPPARPTPLPSRPIPSPAPRPAPMPRGRR